MLIFYCISDQGIQKIVHRYHAFKSSVFVHHKSVVHSFFFYFFQNFIGGRIFVDSDGLSEVILQVKSNFRTGYGENFLQQNQPQKIVKIFMNHWIYGMWRFLNFTFYGKTIILNIKIDKILAMRHQFSYFTVAQGKNALYNLLFYFLNITSVCTFFHHRFRSEEHTSE